jgi:hypothetical protein
MWPVEKLHHFSVRRGQFVKVRRYSSQSVMITVHNFTLGSFNMETFLVWKSCELPKILQKSINTWLSKLLGNQGIIFACDYSFDSSELWIYQKQRKILLFKQQVTNA